MTEKNKYPPLIENTKFPNTIDSMAKEMKALGIEEGDTAIVHSSLSALGWVCCDQSAVVLALIKAFGPDGTIVMPAHTSSNSDPAEWEHPPVPEEWHETIRQTIPAFDKAIAPSEGMGLIAECFRTYPGTLRSNHPQVSFTARGKHAGQITGQHVLTPFFGIDTPLGALYQLNAKVFLLGVDYSKCTAFHLAEALYGQLKLVKEGCAICENGTRLWKWFEDYDYDGDDFQRLGEAFEAGGSVSVGMIGNAECRLFHVKPAVDFAVEWMRENRAEVAIP